MAFFFFFNFSVPTGGEDNYDQWYYYNFEDYFRCIHLLLKGTVPQMRSGIPLLNFKVQNVSLALDFCRLLWSHMRTRTKLAGRSRPCVKGYLKYTVAPFANTFSFLLFV